MADLVEQTGSTRQSIYADFESKQGLYSACFDHYFENVVRPAIRPLTNEGAGFASIAAYFETQISLAETTGLPGPGCLVANAMTETAPNNAYVLEHVEAHNARLRAAFSQALPAHLTPEARDELAEFLVVATQGLWSMSRVVRDPAILRRRADTIIKLVERETANG